MLRAVTMVLYSTVSLAARPPRMDSVLAKDPCPHLAEAAAHSIIRDLVVPYRIVNTTTHGLGLFALRKIRKGEAIMHDTKKTLVQLTPENWKQVAKVMIQHRAWKALPKLDAAYKKFMGKGGQDVPEEMLAAYFRNVQSHIQTVEGFQVVLAVGDGAYTNDAKRADIDEEDYEDTDAKGASLFEDHKDLVALAVKEDLFQRALDEIKDSRLPDVSPGVYYALEDIEPCTEILENYDADGDNDSFPDWVISMLKEHGGITKASGILVDLDDKLVGIHANMGD